MKNDCKLVVTTFLSLVAYWWDKHVSGALEVDWPLPYWNIVKILTLWLQLDIRLLWFDVKIINTTKTNTSSSGPSSRNLCKEIIEIYFDSRSEAIVVGSPWFWDCLKQCKFCLSLISHFFRSIFGLWNSNKGNPLTIECLWLSMKLKEIMHAKWLRTTWIGSNSLVISQVLLQMPDK